MMSGAATGFEAVRGVLVDTSFLIRLLKTDDPLHTNAKAWFKELMDRKVPMFLSTIVLAEWCVKGSLDQLPVRNLRVLPFNVDHALRAGPLADVLLQNRTPVRSDERNLVLNDVKLLAQAEASPEITHILTKDGGYAKRITLLREKGHVVNTQVLDLNVPMASSLGRLDFPE
jgi:predicted nucleic acid-binding protein